MKNIAIVCGGNSGEYEISMGSGKVVEAMLDKSKYTAFLIVIRFNDWVCLFPDGKRKTINKSDFSLSIDTTTIHFDAVFNAIHGTPGEDGKLQAYFDLLGIPYTSCGVDTSALTFNKYFCNRFVSSFGIKTAEGLSFFRGTTIDETAIVEQLGLPLFVKPSCSGSSVGISRVNTIDDLSGAIEKAFLEDERILVEKCIIGRELACGVIHDGTQLIVLPLTEIVSKNEFFDYEAKYTKGMADEITPAPIDTEAELDIKAVSSMLYHEMNCKGFVRFDYILTEDELYFLEVNTIPGITEASILPQMANDYGLNLTEFFSLALDPLFNKA